MSQRDVVHLDAAGPGGASHLAAGLQHDPAALEAGRAHPRRDRRPTGLGACPQPRCQHVNHQTSKQGTLRLSGYIQGSTSRAIVHSAGIQDRGGAAQALEKIRRRFNWLELMWADGGYNACLVHDAVGGQPCLRMEIGRRSDDTKGFVVLPRRWAMERTFY